MAKIGMIIVYLTFSIAGLAQIIYDVDDANVVVDLPEISMLSIEPDNSDVILFISSTLLENITEQNSLNVNNQDKWLNYTVSKSSSSGNRRIDVSRSYSFVLNFVTLSVTASPAIGGAGTLGTPNGKVDLTTTPQSLIYGIGPSYTGTGTGNGHKLEYSLTVSSWPSGLIGIFGSVYITYTLAED